MSKTESKVLSKTPVLKKVLLTDFKIPVIIPKEVEDKIRYLCSQIVKEEWSGVLFYTTEGTIKDPTNMKITLQDILPMNKGNGTYTEYAHDESIVEYMMEDPVRLRWQRGHIHSHNIMGVFFSPTDDSELNDNLGFYNYYLSIIVNNYGDITGKVAFQTHVPSASFIAKDENGNEYSLSNDSKVDPIMFMYECEFPSVKPLIEVSDFFKDRVAFIIKKHAFASKQQPTWKAPNYGGYAGEAKKEVRTYTDNDLEDLLAVDSFLIYWFSMGEPTPSGILLDDVITAINVQLTTIDEEDLTDKLINSFDHAYDDYFGKEVEERDYVQDLEYMIDMLKDYNEGYIKEVREDLEQELKNIGDRIADQIMEQQLSVAEKKGEA